MSFQREERRFGQIEPRPLLVGHSTGFALHKLPAARIPPASATAVTLDPLPPFSELVEVNCQDCGGRGYDPGSISSHEPDDCAACGASGKETILRNYLAEAFRIAADPNAELLLERAHLVALTAYARQTISALMMSLPEVA
jgi:hypothetical protein